MPELNAIGIVVSDTERSIRFYRLLGLDVPEAPGEGHVDTFLPNGVRFMLDSEEVLRSFRPDWWRTTGNQVALALERESPHEVDETYARVTGSRIRGRDAALGRLLGPALCAAPRPRRRSDRSLRNARDVRPARGARHRGAQEDNEQDPAGCGPPIHLTFRIPGSYERGLRNLRPAKERV